MLDSAENVYSELLSELYRLEQGLQHQSDEGIEEWKDKVSKVLKGAYLIRFNRLRFYEEQSDSDDDIPF